MLPPLHSVRSPRLLIWNWQLVQNAVHAQDAKDLDPRKSSTDTSPTGQLETTTTVAAMNIQDEDPLRRCSQASTATFLVKTPHLVQWRILSRIP